MALKKQYCLENFNFTFTVVLLPWIYCIEHDKKIVSRVAIVLKCKSEFMCKKIIANYCMYSM